MIYLIRENDVPNTAPENRFIGIVKGLKKAGLEFQIVFIRPTAALDRNPVFKDFDVRYLWKNVRSQNKYIRLMYHVVYYFFIKHFTFRNFCKSLDQGDTVVSFDGASYIHSLLRINGINVYKESTEHPVAIDRVKNKTMMKQYQEDCNKLQGVFVISTALKRYYESIGVNSQKIHIVNMTVDASRFKDIIKQPVKERYIAYCGSVFNNKDGVDLLIRSFIHVAKRIPDVKLYIIGSHPSDTSENDKLIHDGGITDRVVFTGKVDASVMPQLLVNAEVCALARPNSLQAENGFPTKLGEYLLSRNPVVVTRVGDIPLFLKDGESALLCEERNVDEFADKLCWALEHKVEAGRIGANGEKVALQFFNSDTESLKILNVIKPKKIK